MTSAASLSRLPWHGRRAPGAQRIRWWQREESLSAVWVVMLGFPLVAAWLADAGVWQRLVTEAFVLAFAVVYAWSVITIPNGLRLSPLTPARAQLRPVSGRLAVLTSLAALTYPLLGTWCVCFLPFLTAIVLYATTLRVGLVAAVLLTAVVDALLLALVPLLGATGTPADGWIICGCTLSFGMILFSRLADERTWARTAVERELAGAAQREAISRDVHDLLGHSLTVLTLKAEVAQRLVAVDPDRAETELAEIVTLSRAALADVRATVSRLRAPALADQVTASIAALQDAGVYVRTHGASPADLAAIPPSQAEVLAWALREATTNILRHAQASSVTIELARGLLRVSDDGVGLGRHDPHQGPTTDPHRPHGNGLTGLRERVEAAGGTLTVRDLASDAVGPQTGRRQEGPDRADPAPLPTASHGTVLEVRL